MRTTPVIIAMFTFLIPDAPKEGMIVTVYGYSPWNAMVTFAPGTTTTAIAKAIRGLLGRIVEGDARQNPNRDPEELKAALAAGRDDGQWGASFSWKFPP